MNYLLILAVPPSKIKDKLVTIFFMLLLNSNKLRLETETYRLTTFGISIPDKLSLRSPLFTGTSGTKGGGALLFLRLKQLKEIISELK